MNIMRRKTHKHHKRSSAGKVITGLLVGSVVGATVGWLTAPASGGETRRRIKGDLKGVREKVKSTVGDVKSMAREWVADASPQQPLP